MFWLCRVTMQQYDTQREPCQRKLICLLEQVEEIAEYLHFSIHNGWVDAVKYKTSFVNQLGLAYIVANDTITSKVKIKINFLLLPTILKSYLHRAITKVEGKMDLIFFLP